MMTEEQAATKWCPMVRFLIGPPSQQWQEASFSNRAQMDGNAHCLASSCMAWRFTTSDLGVDTHVSPDGVTTYADTQGKLAEAERNGWLRLGYCGLAGRP